MPISCWVTSTPLAWPISDSSRPRPHAALGDALVVVLLGLDLLAPGLGIILAGDLGLELLPDLRELGLDHRRRHFEVVLGGELVEQLALHLRAGEPGGLLLELDLEHLLELVEAVEAERLGKVLVDLALALDLDLLHGDRELGILALEVLRAVVGREGDLDGPGVAGLGADELVLEAWDEGLRADHQRRVLALPPANSSPSMLPTKSMISWSPAAAFFVLGASV
jgi:hypothetical protein